MRSELKVDLHAWFTLVLNLGWARARRGGGWLAWQIFAQVLHLSERRIRPEYSSFDSEAVGRQHVRNSIPLSFVCSSAICSYYATAPCNPYSHASPEKPNPNIGQYIKEKFIQGRSHRCVRMLPKPRLSSSTPRWWLVRQVLHLSKRWIWPEYSSFDSEALG